MTNERKQKHHHKPAADDPCTRSPIPNLQAVMDAWTVDAAGNPVPSITPPPGGMPFDSGIAGCNWDTPQPPIHTQPFWNVGEFVYPGVQASFQILRLLPTPSLFSRWDSMDPQWWDNRTFRAIDPNTQPQTIVIRTL